MNAIVHWVGTSASHTFSKQGADSIELLAGLGVAGDAHAGMTVKHRSRVARDPSQSNLRQVHLLHAELLDELAGQGFRVTPGDIGENITTRGLDLLALPTGAKLHIGDTASIEITGLRNPCVQLDRFLPGLMQATLGRDGEGNLVRKAGVMGIVHVGGAVRIGDPIRVERPTGQQKPLAPV